MGHVHSQSSLPSGLGISQVGSFWNFLTGLLCPYVLSPIYTFHIYARDIFLKCKVDEDSEMTSCYYIIKDELYGMEKSSPFYQLCLFAVPAVFSPHISLSTVSFSIELLSSCPTVDPFRFNSLFLMMHILCVPKHSCAQRSEELLKYIAQFICLSLVFLSSIFSGMGHLRLVFVFL